MTNRSTKSVSKQMERKAEEERGREKKGKR